MATMVTASELKATLFALLVEVSGGEEIEITQGGRTVARLAPAGDPTGLKGRLAGAASSAASDEDLSTRGAWNLS